MQTSLPMPARGDPRRGRPRTTGRRSARRARRRARPDAESRAGPMSSTTRERARTWSPVSRRPGFSAPRRPYPTRFIHCHPTGSAPCVRGHHGLASPRRAPGLEGPRAVPNSGGSPPSPSLRVSSATRDNRRVRTARHGIGIALVLFVASALYLSVRDVALPDATRVDLSIKESEPIQESTDRSPFTVTIGGYTYTLTPKASYDISGLVVSQHRGDALLNLFHEADPGNVKDVCVVWGEVITNGSYQKVRFSSEEFTCYYRWSGVITPPFNPEKMSNNHLIPAAPSVAARIDALHVGDQIRMRGLLVDYRVTKDGQEVFSRRTS